MSGELRRMSDEEVVVALQTLDGWQLADGRLRREFRFASFGHAIGFMMRAALTAEKLDHHPEWSNTYNVVRVELVTHDVAGISTLDLQMARTMNELAAS